LATNPYVAKRSEKPAIHRFCLPFIPHRVESHASLINHARAACSFSLLTLGPGAGRRTQEVTRMHSDLLIINIVVTVLAIEVDKWTQFTHPTLHFIAFAGVLGIVYSLALAT
jgi:hypothetical protein